MPIDKVYCPRCRTHIAATTEFWQTNATVVDCWCAACGWSGLVVHELMVLSEEPAE